MQSKLALFYVQETIFFSFKSKNVYKANTEIDDSYRENFKCVFSDLKLNPKFPWEMIKY